MPISSPISAARRSHSPSRGRGPFTRPLTVGWVAGVLVVFTLSAHAGLAAPKARPRPDRTRDGSAVGEGNTPGPDQGVPQFRPPPVSDPMLTMPPAAPRLVGSWEEALDLIRTKSPDYLASAENIAIAQGQARTALAAVLPTLNAQGSYVHQFIQATIPIANLTLVTPPSDTLTATANLAWNVLNPRGIYGVGTAKKNVEAVKRDFQDRRRIIATVVVNAMLQTLATERVAALNRVGLQTALERLVLTKTRYQFGQGTQLDIDRAQQDVANARSLIVSGDESLRQARETLGVDLGSATPLSAPGGLELEGFETGVARTCKLNNDIEQRPDVVAARLRVEVAERTISDAFLEAAPSIAVVSSFSYSNIAVLGPLATWSAGAVLNLPLYDGGARYGRLRIARATTAASKQTLEAVRLRAIVAAAQAERGVQVTRNERDIAQQQRDLAARVDARTRDGYARGLGTSLDLVTSAQALRQADINLAVLDFQVAQARANAVLANAECVY